MKAFTRRNPLIPVALAACMAVGGAAFVYSQTGTIGGPGVRVASVPGAPAGKPAAPLSAGEKKAVTHVAKLSEAFRAAAERVLPAVVSIQHTTQPKMVKHEARPRLNEGRSRLPKDLGE